MEHRSYQTDFIIPNDCNTGGNQRNGKLAANVASPELQQTQHMEGGPLNCTDTELCTYLQALGEGYLPTYYSDTNQSAQSKLTPIASKYYRRGKKTVAFHGFPSLEMSRPSTADHGVGWWTWYLEDFLAKTSVPQEKAPALTETNQACGGTWHELSARFDLDTCSWRTHRCLWDEVLPESSVTLPRWGMMQDGVLWERIMPEHRTSETESGLWPTPRAGNPGSRPNRKGGKILAEEVAISVKMWPTPRASPNENRQTKPTPSQLAGTHGMSLGVAVNMWPTPSVCGNHNRKGASATSGDGLATAVNIWPTPTVNDSKNNNPPSQANRNTPPLNVVVGGTLNPTWVEWLMGWPLGWTSMAPMPESTWAAWQQAFSIEPIDCAASETVKCPQQQP